MKISYLNFLKLVNRLTNFYKAIVLTNLIKKVTFVTKLVFSICFFNIAAFAQNNLSDDFKFGSLSKGELATLASDINSAITEAKSFKPKSKPNSKVILHIKGNSGLIIEPTLVDKEAQEQVRKMIPEFAKASYESMLKDFKQELMSKTLIPLCEEDDRRLVAPLKELKPGQIKQLKPMLMLQNDLKPQDPLIAFGVNTKVMGFDTEILAGIPDMFKTFGFGCLPVQMLITKRGIEALSGKIALKNYDADENGRMDPTVERLWDELLLFYSSRQASKFGDRLEEFK